MARAHPALDATAITGLVLAGGQGRRMGGIDKGLQTYQGVPLAWHAARRLAPQVHTVMLNANRHLDVYAQWGLPVWPDEQADFAGPLAGLAAGLSHCTTPYLMSVPCDSPLFPNDLVARLTQALVAQDACIAMVRSPDSEHPDGARRDQPVFALLRADLGASLARYNAEGGRKMTPWFAQHRCAVVEFDDARAFANANTLDELHALEHAHGPALS